jgi:hypothetical protein
MRDERKPAAQLAAGFFRRVEQGARKSGKFMFCLDFGLLIS